MTGPRRGNGEGRLRIRADGLYETTLQVKDALGRKKTKSFYGKTQKEAIAKKQAYKRDLEQGAPVDATKQTLEAYTAGWLKTDAPRHIKPHVLRSYEPFIRLYITPRLGHLPLAAITTAYVQAMVDDIVKCGLSASTATRCRSILQSILGDAQRTGLIHTNPARGARPPSVRRIEMKYWTPDQARTFLAFVQEHPIEAYYVLSLTVGLRIGEALGLRWSDIDLERGTLTVRQTLYQGRVTDPQLGDTKTRSGRRTVRLSRVATEALHRHRTRQEALQRIAGAQWQNTAAGMVFTSASGYPLAQRNVSRQFKLLTGKAELPPIRVHDMRHTAATLMLASGVPIKVVADTLGHSSIRVTLDIYGHLLDEQKQAAADAMDRLLTGL